MAQGRRRGKPGRKLRRSRTRLISRGHVGIGKGQLVRHSERTSRFIAHIVHASHSKGKVKGHGRQKVGLGKDHGSRWVGRRHGSRSTRQLVFRSSQRLLKGGEGMLIAGREFRPRRRTVGHTPRWFGSWHGRRGSRINGHASLGTSLQCALQENGFIVRLFRYRMDFGNFVKVRFMVRVRGLFFRNARTPHSLAQMRETPEKQGMVITISVAALGNPSKSPLSHDNPEKKTNTLDTTHWRQPSNPIR